MRIRAHRIDMGIIIVPVGIIIVIIVIIRVGVAGGIIGVIAVDVVAHIARIRGARGQGQNQTDREPITEPPGLKPPACAGPGTGPGR